MINNILYIDITEIDSLIGKKIPFLGKPKDGKMREWQKKTVPVIDMTATASLTL